MPVFLDRTVDEAVQIVCISQRGKHSVEGLSWGDQTHLPSWGFSGHLESCSCPRVTPAVPTPSWLGGLLIWLMLFLFPHFSRYSHHIDFLLKLMLSVFGIFLFFMCLWRFFFFVEIKNTWHSDHLKVYNSIVLSIFTLCNRSLWNFCETDCTH